MSKFVVGGRYLQNRVPSSSIVIIDRPCQGESEVSVHGDGDEYG